MNTRLIRYEGKVQGVGFRASVLALARGYDIAGYVKNLPDGRVELLTQGDDQEISDFFRAIAESHLRGHIQHEEEIILSAASTQPERGFRML